MCALAPTARAAGQAPPQTPGAGVVAGQVIDDTAKQPVGGAVVTLSAVAGAGQPPIPAAQARRGVAVANADGRFVFRDVPAGAYTLSATMNNYSPGATGRRRPSGPSSTFTLAASQRITDAVIAVWRLSSISGTLTDDRGEPAVGVSVWAMRRVLAADGPEWSFTGGTVEATDDRGFFRLSGLAPGTYTVQVRGSTQTNPVAVVAAWRAATNAQGPVGGNPFAGRPRAAMESGAINIERGGFEVDGWQVKTSIGAPQPLPGPKGTVLVHPTTYYGNTTSAADARVITLAAGEDRAGVDLVLPLVTGQRISGALYGPDGPAAGHGVRLDPPVGYSTTDAQGRFALLGIPPGNYTLRAYRVPVDPVMLMRMTGEQPPADAGPPAPSLFVETPITVGASAIDNLSLTLAPGATLSGRVEFAGTKTPPTAEQIGRMALTLRASDAGPSQPTRFDSSGTFRTAGHAAGRYLISVTPPAPGWTLSSMRVRGVEVAGRDLALEHQDLSNIVITFVDTVITLNGLVTSDDASISPEATVVVMPADVAAWIRSGISPLRIASTTTSVSGVYQLTVSLPGDYLLVAVPPEVEPEVTPEFAARFAAGATRVSLAAGETKAQPLTLRRPR
jgi:protocatechuate 3,4-dioxygenase beta subunit